MKRIFKVTGRSTTKKKFVVTFEHFVAITAPQDAETAVCRVNEHEYKREYFDHERGVSAVEMVDITGVNHVLDLTIR